jgi:hypothetical protein
MAMNRASFPKDLEEGLNAHFGMEYREYPEEYSKVLTPTRLTRRGKKTY